MTVKNLLEQKGRDVCTISPDATVFDALALMAEKDIGSLVVMDDEKLIGIVTERHYLRNVILKGKRSPTTLVKDIMDRNLIHVRPEQTIELCMALMTENRVRHLPVVEGKKVIGIISIGDLLKSIISKQKFSGVSVELIDELQEALADMKADHEKRTEIAELTDTLRGNLEKIVQHGKRADAIVKNMLLHSRQGSAEHRPVDINAIVEESLNLAYHGARAEKQGFSITLERSLDPEAGQVDCFPQEITRVLLNMISNGFYAATKHQGQTKDAGAEPTLTAATRNLGDRVEITIRDNGTGISPEVKDQMFNPFFTTKPAGEGTGLAFPSVMTSS